MNRTLQIALATASLLALVSCAQTADQVGRSNRQHLQMTAKEVTAELKLGAVVSGEKLGANEREAVKYFASAFQDEGHGAVIISRPSNGPDDISALRAAADARALMLAEGIEPADIVEGPYDATGSRSAPLVLSYKTWEAVVPNCPDVSHYEISWTGTNSSLPSFGCALTTNLAAMIADPSDLIGRQIVDPADSSRRLIVFSKYRKGEITAAERSEDADATISDAVE